MNRDEIIRILLDKELRWNAQLSFSQDGEDLLMCNYLNLKKKGFYIDIGALHPIRYSNTMMYYMKGWSGINIDAMPGSMELFKKYRKRDVNIEAGISDTGEKMMYYMYDEPACNTFDSDLVEERQKLGQVPVRSIEIPTYRIMELVDKYLEPGKEIDILDIDIEGFDKCIIKDWNFDKYKPNVILFERSNNTDSTTHDKLLDKGYFVAATSKRNDIYVLQK